MPKAIVKTSKNIMLMDPQTLEIIEEHKPSLVVWTQFIESRVGKGEIMVLAGKLPNEASADEFNKYWTECEGQEELAIESFLSSLTAEPEPESKPKKSAKKAGE